MNDIQIKLGKEIQQGKRTFTQLIGGFGENKPVISDKQVAELLGYKLGARQVRQTIDRNKNYFTLGLHIEDLKGVAESNTFTNTLISLGYSKQSITQAKNIYIFSQAGFLLFLKFAEGNNAVEIYKNFIEDYFKTKAENKVMQLSIEEEIEKLKEDKKFLLGAMFMENDEGKKIELFNKNEEINRRISTLEKSLTEEEVVKKLQPKISLADKIANGSQSYDMNLIAKVFDVENLGRNNMFKWLRNMGVLMKNNQPYQRYKDYFEVVLTEKVGYVHSKTLVKPKGVAFIYRKLIESGQVVYKTVEEIIEELSKEE